MTLNSSPKDELIPYRTVNDVARVEVLDESETLWLYQPHGGTDPSWR